MLFEGQGELFPLGEEGGALGVLFRPERHRFESSPASLRLLMTQGEHKTQLELIKVQGGRPGPVDLGGV